MSFSFQRFKTPTIVCLWIGLGLFFGWFFLQRFPLNGIRIFSFDYDGTSPWFTAFQPAQRATSIGVQPDGWVGQRIFSEPVYATARLPGQFDSADIDIQFRPNQLNLAEFGIVRNEEPFQAELEPIWTSVIGQSLDWRYVRIDGHEGYVRSGLPDSALMGTDPKKILTWYATSTLPDRNEDVVAPVTWNVSLRGAHDFHFIATKEPVFFHFSLQDVNRTHGENVAAFQLSKDDQTVSTEALSLGGSHDVRPDGVFQKDVDLGVLPPGTYKLSLIAQDDIFIRSMSTNARHWVIGPRLFLADQVGWATSTPPVSIWTNSNHIGMQILHTDAEQIVSLGTASALLQKDHVYYSLDRKQAELSQDQILYLPKSNVRILADGYFAFQKDQLFLPHPRRLTSASQPLEEGIDVILTPYKLLKRLDDGWYEASIHVTLPGAVDSVKYTLALPGIQLASSSLDIRHITIQYHRAPLSFFEFWQALKLEVRAFLRRL